MGSASLASLAPLHPQQNLHSVFVYGSLMADEVLRILLKRTPQSSDAVLNGYQRLSIKGRVYPAIIPVDSKKVSGKILSGIKNSEMDILDAFEDVEYKRITVEVSSMDSLEKLLVYAYVWGNEKDPDLYGDWDFEEWKRDHLEAYIKMVNEFMEEFEQQTTP
ncbi:AIG2-like protein D isoform X2 [Benincasa hispida]|uniref:AIG2-like protein D isoform X2 n=1 Tax=Benincasa hispida TaxID=102211 RepID=UPI0018FF6AE8|nr:AIG2-like protein D isoform X2 [Benincasa hispida]